MNDTQIKYAEEIISHIKKNNNSEHQEVLMLKFGNIKTREISIILSYLINPYDLLRLENSNLTLTKKGIDFISFQKLREEEQFQKEKERIDFEKLKVDLKLNKWLLKTKWLPHFITFISFLFTVIVYFCSKNDSKKIEERIEKLESTQKVQKHESKK